jgi:hypothetical protein
VKCDYLVNILRNGRCNGLAEEGSLWRVFVLGMWIVVGCADVQKISMSPFSCFEYICFCTECVAAFSGISRHGPAYWRAVRSLCFKNLAL